MVFLRNTACTMGLPLPLPSNSEHPMPYVKELEGDFFMFGFGRFVLVFLKCHSANS